MYGKVVQSLAPNSLQESVDDLPYDAKDRGMIEKQMMPNNRMNCYSTNMYAGPGESKKGVKHKGKIEHPEMEDELGDDYEL